jgi:hypothetical protein
MRCDDLTRELASPTGAVTEAEMAGHLADCAACAKWANQAARFDQIWEATRPLEPSAAKLDALWRDVSAALEAQTAPAPLRLEGVGFVSRRPWIKPAFVLAQAAALLFAAGLYLTRTKPAEIGQVVEQPVEKTSQPAQVARNTPVESTPLPDFSRLSRVEANDGETLRVSIPLNPVKGKAFEVVRLKDSTPEDSNLIPPVTPFDAINAAELMVSL